MTRLTSKNTRLHYLPKSMIIGLIPLMSLENNLGLI